MMKKVLKYPLKALLAVLLGMLAGVIIGLFIKIMTIGMEFLWETLPYKFDFPVYPLIVCVVGALFIGLFQKFFGDYPEELMVVLDKVKKDKNYEYKKLPIIFVGALMPVVFGFSVGPEAGLAGVITAICYFIKDRLGFNKGEYKKIVKIIFYLISLAAALATMVLINRYFGQEMKGFPMAEKKFPSGIEWLGLLLYIPAGFVLGVFYEVTHKGLHGIADKIPPILKEVIGGICVGAIGCMVPLIMFSGEEGLHELYCGYIKVAPVVFIALAFLKVAMTNISIQMGLKGGHFFPLIFAAACLGYGIATLVFPESADTLHFAAAIVAGTTLGYTMKKPILVSLILMICFPPMMVPFILATSFLGSFVGKKIDNLIEKRNRR